MLMPLFWVSFVNFVYAKNAYNKYWNALLSMYFIMHYLCYKLFIPKIKQSLLYDLDIVNFSVCCIFIIKRKS